MLLKRAVKKARQMSSKRKKEDQQKILSEYLETLNSAQIDAVLKCKRKDNVQKIPAGTTAVLLFFSMLFY